jgi:glycosyltransferase involved in cell wall biosynthesis
MEPWSGILTVIVHLSAALAKRGHQVEVWQLREWPRATFQDQRRWLDQAGVTQVQVALSTPIWRLGRAVQEATEDRSIDLVHLHGAFNRWNTAISPSLRRPYVFSPHSGYDPVSLRRSRARKTLYGLLFERSMLDRASLVVALTDVELDQIRAFGTKSPVAVIPNGVSAPATDVDRLAFRRELQLAARDHLAVFVGRLDVHRKGLDRLVRGLAEAPTWHLALVGPRFRDVARLEEMIADLAIGGRVHFTDERHGEPLREAFAGADLFVLPSRWEGLPMALLEAMSNGAPAVVSPEVGRLVDVEGAGAGWIAQSGDLGTMLRHLGEDGVQELPKRKKRARELAGRYRWDHVAEQYETAYRQAQRSTVTT